MSEEIKDASLTLPRAMMWTVIINGSLGFIMLVTFCFCLGDVDTILSDSTVTPFVQTFLIATKSHAGTSVMTAILIILTIAGCITNVATASRQMFAFARDQGLPFSNFLAHVSDHAPFNHDITKYHKLINLLCVKGSPRLGYPPKRSPNLLLHNIPPLPNKHRFNRSLQRHRLAGDGITDLLLHNLHNLHPHKTVAWRRTTFSSLEPW